SACRQRSLVKGPSRRAGHLGGADSCAGSRGLRVSAISLWLNRSPIRLTATRHSHPQLRSWLSEPPGSFPQGQVQCGPKDEVHTAGGQTAGGTECIHRCSGTGTGNAGDVPGIEPECRQTLLGSGNGRNLDPDLGRGTAGDTRCDARPKIEMLNV